MAHLTNFSFECFYEIFTEDASLRLLYHDAKKVKNDQKPKSRRGAALMARSRVFEDLTLRLVIPNKVF